jgi:dihydroorotase
VNQTKIKILRGKTFEPNPKTFTEKNIYVLGTTIVDEGTYLRDKSSAEKVIDAQGLYVSPGFIDLHTHVFKGQDLGVDADLHCLPFGVTTVLDAGSAGAHLMGAFKSAVVDNSKTSIFALINISTIGTTSILLKGELVEEYCSVEQAKSIFNEHRDFLVGVKVRASHNVGGEFTLEALSRARRLADELDVPLMVHLGPAPATVEQILSNLRAGDFLTHAFTGWDNSLTQGENIKKSTFNALARGVKLDVGHGMGGFDSTVTKVLIDAAIQPTTISTDIHSYSLEDCKNLPFVMSKFIALGMSLEDVLVSVTKNPANFLGISTSGYASLEPKTPADIVIFDLVQESIDFKDCHGNHFSGDSVIRPVTTIKAGEEVKSP